MALLFRDGKRAVVNNPAVEDEREGKKRVSKIQDEGGEGGNMITFLQEEVSLDILFMSFLRGGGSF